MQTRRPNLHLLISTVVGVAFILTTPALAAEQSESPSEAKATESAGDNVKMRGEVRSTGRPEFDDRAWQPSHVASHVIDVPPKSDGSYLSVTGFCLDHKSNLLVCCGYATYSQVKISTLTGKINPGKSKLLSKTSDIRTFSPGGKLLATWPLDFAAEVVCPARHGGFFVGGDGKVARLSGNGKVLATVDSPEVAALKAEQEESRRVAEKTEDAEKAAAVALREKAMKQIGINRCPSVTGIAASRDDVFVASPSRNGFGYSIWRMDSKLENAECIVTRLRGCCGQMDIKTHADVYGRNLVLWVAENSKHRVICYDRDGNRIREFGERGRTPDKLGGCCEPKNIYIGQNGNVYTSESGAPAVIKQFTPEGKFLGVVALPEWRVVGCKRVAVGVSSDGTSVFMMKPEENQIHVFVDKNGIPTHREVGLIDFPDR
jgi:hypothetical protein